MMLYSSIYCNFILTVLFVFGANKLNWNMLFTRELKLPHLF
jgi:hypothetical protein